MTFVKPLQSPEPKNYTDPYADGYDADLEGDYGNDLYGEDFGDLGEGDMYVEGEDPMGGEPSGGLELGQIEGEIEKLYDFLEEFQGSDTKKAALKLEIDALKKQINKIAFKEGEELQSALQELSAEVAVVQTKITGIDPNTGEEDPSFALGNSIEQTLDAVKNNENLNEEAKQEFTEKLEKLLVSLETPGMGDPDSLMEQYEQIKAEFEETAMHPAVINDLADFTGLDTETLERLFKKYDIDPQNLPTPPDSSMAALLNDPEFAATLQPKYELAKTNNQMVVEAVDRESNACISWNATAREGDTSKTDDIPPSFKNLYELKTGEHEMIKGLKEARKNCATEVAKILSAIYGKDVTAAEGDDQAGMILFDGQALNVMGASDQQVAFSSEDPTFPDVNLVAVAVDDGGDGQTNLPSWMRNAGYPYDVYDKSGGACESDNRDGAGGIWNYQINY